MDEVAINTSKTLTLTLPSDPASNLVSVSLYHEYGDLVSGPTSAVRTASGVYTITLRGILKITTQGTIIPQYNLSANLTSAGTATTPRVLYFNLQQLDTQSAAAFGPAGTGWG